MSCWAGDRLEYRFGTAGVVDGKEVVLLAPEYTGGDLDWSTFDVATGASLMEDGLDADSTPLTATAELEEGDVNFGAVDAGGEDLSRLLLTDFALLYGIRARRRRRGRVGGRAHRARPGRRADPPQHVLPLGRIVANGDLVRDEEVPRTGVSVVRAYRQARWRGGSSLLWIGRDRRLSQDEGPSGLRYDATD